MRLFFSTKLNRILSVLLLFFALKAFSQPINDECAGAIFLPNINNYCSGNAAFTNASSTASGFGLPTCWTATATEDVWFTFTATGTDVLISASGSGNGGTMVRPRITIYFGNCAGTINQLACSNGTAGSGTTQLYQGALLPGTVYLIRISTIAANEGSFELCVNNYTPNANPGADCNGAAFLCNDNPVSVPSLLGGGLNNDEPESSSCLEDPFGPDEGNSSWYYWQAGNSGLFAFDILPVNPTDDIDYILYQLSGNNPCGARTILRCNASACLNVNGSTGLNYTDTDLVEDINCDPGENAYCAPINMVAGTYYALLVNNFSTSNGYTINFNTISNGGTIRGPEPVITATPISICAGNAVTFNGSNSSNVAGGLTWNFVNGGSPTSASGTGPHVVTYATPGNYTAILNGTDVGGCSKTESVIITVTASPQTTILSQTNVACFGESTGAININVSGGTAAYNYNWGSGVNSEDRTGIPAGSYTVTVTDANLCTSTISATITEPASALSSNINNVINATCTQGAAIDINVGGGTAPYTYLWSNGSTDQDISNLGGGSYSLTVTDANACTNVVGPVNITGVSALLINNVSTTNAYCGVNSGTINLDVTGGTAPYNYSWSNAASIEDLSGLSGGSYSLTVTDANACTQTVSNIIINGSSAVSISVNSTNELCGQTGTGSVNINVNGGTSAYSYLWNNGDSNQNITSAAAGNYTVTVTDINGCTSTATAIVSTPLVPTPDALILPGLTTDTVLALGQSVSLSGGNAQSNVTYSWTYVGPGNSNFSAASAINSTALTNQEGDYIFILTAQSSDGCVAVDSVFVLFELRDPKIPTAFSPNNGDNNNNSFYVINLDKSLLQEFKVFNRWGQLVFDDISLGSWDGKFKDEDQPRDVYLYVISWKSVTDDSIIVKRGQVTLMR